jgi:hypothetical protein
MKRWILIFTGILGVALVFAACALPAIQPVPALVPATEDAAEADILTEEDPMDVVSQRSVAVIEDDAPPPFNTREWTTDFSRRTVDWDEIISGGPPKDGIPAIDNPTFESIEAASQWLTKRDPVIVFEHEGVARAYPLAILMWHEIANDEIAGLPVSVTFCPLCNASIVFDRRFDGVVLDFGTTGRLRNSDLIMYDRQSETWWQQFTGQGIVGKYAGEQLRFLPSQVIAYGDFVAQYDQGEVLARPGSGRSYGRNPYVGYDSTDRPFLFQGQIDDRLPATERIVGLTTETETKAYPFSAAAAEGAINDEFGGAPLVVFHKSGTASALDESEISRGEDVGSAGVFDRRAGDQILTFRADDEGNFIDEETGTVWNILGQAVSGPLAGEALTPILHFDHFWFAWAAFFPETDLYLQ